LRGVEFEKRDTESIFLVPDFILGDVARNALRDVMSWLGFPGSELDWHSAYPDYADALRETKEKIFERATY
jgi:hypothetical protein